MTAGRQIESKSIHWNTPKKYVDAVLEVFRGPINLDPCSNKWSIVPSTISYDSTGLISSWDYNYIYVNPPYGRDPKNKTSIKDWLRRCHESHMDYDSQVIALIPVATNTSHWKEYVWSSASQVCFLYDTRLKFLIKGKEEGTGAPMACAMVYWGSEGERFEKVFEQFGKVVDV